MSQDRARARRVAWMLLTMPILLCIIFWLIVHMSPAGTLQSTAIFLLFAIPIAIMVVGLLLVIKIERGETVRRRKDLDARRSGSESRYCYEPDKDQLQADRIARALADELDYRDVFKRE